MRSVFFIVGWMVWKKMVNLENGETMAKCRKLEMTRRESLPNLRLSRYEKV